MKIKLPHTKIIEVDVPERVILVNAITLMRKAWDLPKGVYQGRLMTGTADKLMIDEECHTSHSYTATHVYRPITSNDMYRLETLKELEVLCQN
jgi:hypothetical protein